MTPVTESSDLPRESGALTTALAHHSSLFRAFTDHVPVGVGFASADFRLVYANDRWRELSGFEGALPASAATVLDLVVPDDRDEVVAGFARAAELGEEVRVQVRVVTRATPDATRHLLLTVRRVTITDSTPDHQPLGYSVGLSDVTELVDNLGELGRSEERFRSVTQALPVGVFRADPYGTVTWANDAMEAIAGRTLADGPPSVFEWVYEGDREMVIRRAEEAQAHREPFESTHRMMRADGSVRWVLARTTALRDESGRLAEYVGTVEDITEMHLRTEGLAHQAAHDLLTGLPNRARLESVIAELCQNPATRSNIGIVFIDLDGFKSVNDTFGHKAGDAALVEVGRRLASVLRGSDVVGRYGGDEFVVVCPQVPSTEAVEALALRLRHVVSSRPILDGERSYHLGASVGTAIGPFPDETPAELLHRADESMYAAKRAAADPWAQP